MNAFTWLLLAFPFYLAVNRRLVKYVELAAPATPPQAAV